MIDSVKTSIDSESIETTNNANSKHLATESEKSEAVSLSESAIESKKDDEPPYKKLRLETAVNIKPTAHSSPKKRLAIANLSKPKSKTIFQYGNYSRYYGYRNTNDFQDVRLHVFALHKDTLFAGKQILDIGCNSGLLTMSFARDFSINHITGLDIDKTLINQAKKFIEKQRRESPKSCDRTKFPFNITFLHGNYVLRNPILLDVKERHQFDLILCLSVTKWIHLNFGDTGLKLAFRRMHKQLRPGGKLVLEPQPWESYKRRKLLTAEINKIYKSISFFPKDFTDYLLSEEVGFKEMYELGQPSHNVKGFQRPIQVFIK